MVQKSNNRLIELPDRKEITLCEAVTAFIYGMARDAKAYQATQLTAGLGKKLTAGLGKELTKKQKAEQKEQTAKQKEPTAKVEDLLERLYSAAYAGSVKFRAVKEGEDGSGGFRDIDPLYFYVKPIFNWPQDVIVRLEDESSTPWYFVHLDREQFASLLRGMDVSVKESDSNHPDVPGERKIDTSGVQGRPSSLHRALELAESRLNAADYPATKTEFAKQIAEAVKEIRPRVPKTGQKALMNNADFKELWRTLGPKK